jgi:hypothetical protein
MDERAGPSGGYYRIRAVTSDGGSIWSPVVKARGWVNTSTRVYPNPAGKQIFIETDQLIGSSFVVIQIKTVDGRTVREATVNFSTPAIEVGDLHPGLYTAIITSRNTKLVAKFIKN